MSSPETLVPRFRHFVPERRVRRLSSLTASAAPQLMKCALTIPCERQQRLAFVIDEDVRPPERMLDELEPLHGDVRGIPANVDEVAQDVIARGGSRLA